MLSLIHRSSPSRIPLFPSFPRPRYARTYVCACACGGSLAQTTGLVGLAVNPQARSALVELYQKTLVSLAEIPESAEYRQATEKLTRHRLAVVSAESDRETIERSAS